MRLPAGGWGLVVAGAVILGRALAPHDPVVLLFSTVLPGLGLLAAGFADVGTHDRVRMAVLAAGLGVAGGLLLGGMALPAELAFIFGDESDFVTLALMLLLPAGLLVATGGALGLPRPGALLALRAGCGLAAIGTLATIPVGYGAEAWILVLLVLQAGGLAYASVTLQSDATAAA